MAKFVFYLAARVLVDLYPRAAEAADAIAACLGKPVVSGTLPPQSEWIVARSGPADGGDEPDVAAAVALVDAAPAVARKRPVRPPRPRWVVPALGGLGLLAASVVAALLLLRPAPKPVPSRPPEVRGEGGAPETAAAEPASGSSVPPAEGVT